MSDTSTHELQTLVYQIAIYNSETAYKKLFGTLFNSLFRFSYCILKSRELSEEVASDVMVKLWQKRIELLQIQNIHVYALVIARNVSLNLLKDSNTGKVVPFVDVHKASYETLSPEEILINAQNKARLEGAVNALPTRCRLVFQLTKEEGLSYREVAEVLNISPKTVDAHLVTAMKKLSHALKTDFYSV